MVASDAFGETHFIPIKEVFEDIKLRTGTHEVSVATQRDIDQKLQRSAAGIEVDSQSISQPDLSPPDLAAAGGLSLIITGTISISDYNSSPPPTHPPSSPQPDSQLAVERRGSFATLRKKPWERIRSNFRQLFPRNMDKPIPTSPLGYIADVGQRTVDAMATISHWTLRKPRYRRRGSLED